MLTLEDTGLVSGVPLRAMQKTTRIEVTRAFRYKGEVLAVGTVFEYETPLALEAIACGKAKRAADPPPTPPAPVTPPPATTTQPKSKG